MWGGPPFGRFASLTLPEGFQERPLQRGFLPGRSMLENLVDVDDAMVTTAGASTDGVGIFFDLATASIAGVALTFDDDSAVLAEVVRGTGCNLGLLSSLSSLIGFESPRSWVLFGLMIG